jgi:hypothetical protein
VLVCPGLLDSSMAALRVRGEIMGSTIIKKYLPDPVPVRGAHAAQHVELVTLHVHLQQLDGAGLAATAAAAAAAYGCGWRCSMGSQTCRIVGKSQPLHIMINPIIFTRTRIDAPCTQCQRHGDPNHASKARKELTLAAPTAAAVLAVLAQQAGHGLHPRLAPGPHRAPEIGYQRGKRGRTNRRQVTAAAGGRLSSLWLPWAA